MATEDITMNIPPLVWCENLKACIAVRQVQTRPDVAMLKLKFGLYLDSEFPKPSACKDHYRRINQAMGLLLKIDEVAFRNRESALNFIDYCREVLQLETDESEMIVKVKGKPTWVCSLPLGLPFERYKKLIKMYLPLLEIPPFETCFILRVDPLVAGCSKSVRRRFREFLNLTNYEPASKGMIVFLQVFLLEGEPCVSFSGEIMEEKIKIELLVEEINSKYSATKWKPIVIFYGLPSQPELESFYEDSRYLQSFGMDYEYVDKEFLLFKTDTNPQRLVFVNYFGCCSQMREANLIRDELPQLRDNLMRLLYLPEKDKVDTILKMSLKPAEFLEEYLMRLMLILADSVVAMELMESRHVTTTYLEKRLSQYSHITLAIDLDGTLIDRPKGALHATILNPQLREVLNRLKEHPKLDIIIHGASHAEAILEKVNVQNITYVGNLGCNIIYKDGTRWEETISRNLLNKKFDMVNELHARACKFGSYTEDRGCILTYNSSLAPPIFSRNLVSIAKDVAISYGFPVHRWRNGLMIHLLPGMNKGKGLDRVLTTERGSSWMHQTQIVFVGDELCDENAIRYIKTKTDCIMLRVTKGYFPKSQGIAKLTDSRCVLTFLQWLEKNYI